MDHFASFLSQIKVDFQEWKDYGFCTRAESLNKKLHKEYFDISNPHYFTGDIYAPLVLVHLNPKRKKSDFKLPCNFKTFEDYFNYYTKFGEKNYGINSTRQHKSPFDHKQIRFLKPLGILPFSGDKYNDLEIVVDKKLQIELIPYGSPDFDTRFIGTNNINPFIDSVLKLILSSNRKQVIFCGKLFREILKDYIINEENFSFKLEKKNGQETRDNFNIIKIELKVDSQHLNAIIAPQFAKQGSPIEEYGKKLAKLTQY